MNRYSILISFVAALGGLLFGFDTAVVAGTLGYLKVAFNLNAIEQGWLVSSALLGCIPGALVSGMLADRYGRKPVLIASSLFYLISALGCGIATSQQELVMYRIVGGIAIGFASTLAPIYIAEIAPPAYRGRLGMLTQLTITLGILLSYVSNYCIDTSDWLMGWVGGNKPELWRYMFGVAALPSLLFLLTLLLIPESPRWLVIRGHKQQALAIFRRLTASDPEAQTLLEEVESDRRQHAHSSWDELRKPASIRITMTGFVFATLCLFTGINAVLYYAPIIFEKTQVALPPLLQTMFTGVVLFLFTILAFFLIDRVGRKRLLVFGSWLMGGSMAGLAGLFYYDRLDNYGVLALVLIYIAAFALTWGSVVWVLLGEMFPNAIRGKATSIANYGNWQANFLVSVSFPWMIQQWGGATTFVFYALVNLISVWFVQRWLVETKGVSLEGMEALYTVANSTV